MFLPMSCMSPLTVARIIFLFTEGLSDLFVCLSRGSRKSNAAFIVSALMMSWGRKYSRLTEGTAIAVQVGEPHSRFEHEEDFFTLIYRRVMGPLITEPKWVLTYSHPNALAAPLVFTVCALVSVLLSGRLKDEARRVHQRNLQLESELNALAAQRLAEVKEVETTLLKRISVEQQAIDAEQQKAAAEQAALEHAAQCIAALKHETEQSLQHIAKTTEQRAAEERLAVLAWQERQSCESIALEAARQHREAAEAARLEAMQREQIEAQLLL